MQINRLYIQGDRNSKLNLELNELKDKRNLVIDLKANQLDQAIQTLNTLIPSSEDYFSIIRAIETLSSQTGFSITSYRISLSDISKQLIPIQITGTGSTTSIVNFLNGYHHSGGRLITINSLEYSPNATKIDLAINFYNYKSMKSDSSVGIRFDAKRIDKFVAIGESLTKSIGSEEKINPQDFNYPARSNPFGQ